jgi:hypothetical protein
MSGSLMSSSTRSGFRDSASASASLPVLASITWNPA